MGITGDQIQIVNGKPVPKDYALLPREAMTVDARNTALLQLGLTQPVYMGGKSGLITNWPVYRNSFPSKLEQEMQNVIQMTDEAYWQVVSLVNRKKLADKYVESLQKFTRDIEVMYTTGVTTKADVLSVKVKLNEAEMLRLRVEDGVSLSRMHLNQICGLPTDTVYTLREENMELQPDVVIPALTLEQVYARRPEVAGLELAARIYKKKRRSLCRITSRR